MEGQNKHFSHTHNLSIHHVPEGSEITCSGCNSSGTATIYACWQCNFFLHEQCFHAARSLQHPSHTSHPLTLLPFPTYPSNSFYCNSCNQVGTGFTYCCSDCEFDLHVQCAYSISLSSLLTPQTHILPQQNQTPSFGTPQHVYMPHQAVTHQEPIFSPLYASVSHQEPTNQPIPSAPFLNYPIVNEPGPSSTAAQYSPSLHLSHNPQLIPINQFHNYPPIEEIVQNFNNPQSSHIPSYNPPVKEKVQNFNHIQNYPQPSHNHQLVPNNPQNSHILSHNPPIKEKVQNIDHIQNYPQPSLNTQPIPNDPQDSHIPSHGPPINEKVQNSYHIQNYPQPSHNPQPVPNNHIPSYPSINEPLPSLNAPQNSQTTQVVPIPTSPPKAETPVSSYATSKVSYTEPSPKLDQVDHVKAQSSNILSQNLPIKETVQNFDHVQNDPQPSHNIQPIPKNNIPSYPSINETLPSLIAPITSQIPHVASQTIITPNISIPTSETKAEISVSSNATNGVSKTEPPSKPDQVNQVKPREIMHFSHPHALLLVNPKAEEDSIECSACEEMITGPWYSCFKSDCDFHLEESCFGLSQAILHKSHPDHPLTLLSYSCDQYGQFICRACYDDGYGFTYHCTTCEFDLHTKCASLPETVKRDDHEHPLKLLYSCPNKGKDYTFSCDECGGIVQENWWTYYCEECDYGTHVDCVYRGESDQETAVTESQNQKSESSTGNPDLDFQLEMQRLQLELEMARQTAQMTANMGQSISNLAG